MVNKVTTAIVAIILILGLIASSCQPPNPAGGGSVSIGNPAPDFQLQNPDGETVSLSGLRGSPVMLNFWATWCVFCREEMPHIQQIYDNWQQRGLVILGINIRESRNTAREYMEENNLTFPVLLDSSGEVAIRYKVQAIPVSFFIDGDGIIRDAKLGAFQSASEIEDSLQKIMPSP